MNAISIPQPRQKEFLPEEGEDDKSTKVKKPIFSALLRLRQAACHPGLSNPRLRHERSAKQDLLASRIQELVAGIPAKVVGRPAVDEPALSMDHEINGE